MLILCSGLREERGQILDERRGHMSIQCIHMFSRTSSVDLDLSSCSALPNPLSPRHSLYWQLQLAPETNAVFWPFFSAKNSCELVWPAVSNSSSRCLSFSLSGAECWVHTWFLQAGLSIGYHKKAFEHGSSFYTHPAFHLCVYSLFYFCYFPFPPMQC